MYKRFIRSLSKSDVNFALENAHKRIDELESILLGMTESAKDAPFDYRSSQDKDELETFASAIGLEVDKRKSVENIVKDITEHINVGEE